jgi:hypothetical protein
MGMWTAITLIVIAGVMGEAYRNRVKSRNSGINREEVKALNEKMDAIHSELRTRVETLERIVTDSKEDLKRKFDHLDRTG